jgi:hypothetical protein
VSLILGHHVSPILSNLLVQLGKLALELAHELALLIHDLAVAIMGATDSRGRY